MKNKNRNEAEVRRPVFRPVRVTRICSSFEKTLFAEVSEGVESIRGVRYLFAKHIPRTMSYKTGKSKPMAEVSLKDCLKHPIWEWALDEETLPGHDETWQRPITSTKDVTPDMADPTITFRISGSDIVGTAIYDHDSNTLSSISICDDGEWEDVGDLSGFGMPVELIALPTIGGIAGVRFLLSNPKLDLAARLASDAPPVLSAITSNRARRKEAILAFVLNCSVCNGHMCSSADVVHEGMIGLGAVLDN